MSQSATKMSRENSQSVFVWGVPLTLILLAATVLGYFYILPAYIYEPIVETNPVDVEPLYQQIYTLQEENGDLIGALALARRSAEIDGGAAKELLITLSEREKEMRDLEEELNFLRSMVSPGEAKPGLGIRSFVLHALDKPGQYAFKLALVRLGEDGQADVTKGAVKIRVQGIQGGKNKTLSWKDVTAPETRELQFSFQFFQRLRGELNFAEGFEPQNILVKVEPSGKNQSPLQKIYSWSSIYQEGNNHVGKK